MRSSTTARATRHLQSLEGPVVFNAELALRELCDAEGPPLDVLVVGGGITGVSAALDAAARGLRVGLVERHDFASGTSSASSKMVHGGLRYVAQRDFRLVYHSLMERQRLYERAPHLVHRLPFLFPRYDRDGIFGPRAARAFEQGLAAYDLLGGWRIGRRHRRLSVAGVLTECPKLRTDGLRGGFLYYDTRTDDARLTVALARTAATFGARLVNHTEVLSAPRDDHGLRQVRVRHRAPDGACSERVLRCRVLLNAAGVWADRVDRLASGHEGDPTPAARLRPAKGVHVVVPWEKVRSQSTLIFPMLAGGRGPGGTGFVVRWGDHCYVGTTDTAFEGDLDAVHCTAAEATVLLDSLNAALTTRVGLADVTGSWAGLRPLIAAGGSGGTSTAELSREHEVTTAPGLVTVAGGKLTVARSMAEQAVDEACRMLGRRDRCITARLPVIGGAGFDAESSVATGGRFAHLAERYGTEARFVEDLILDEPVLGAPLVAGHPYVRAEVVFAARHEMAASVADVLGRRLPLGLLDAAAAAQAAPDVAVLVARERGLAAGALAEQAAEYAEEVLTDLAVTRGQRPSG